MIYIPIKYLNNPDEHYVCKWCVLTRRISVVLKNDIIYYKMFFWYICILNYEFLVLSLFPPYPCEIVTNHLKAL